MKDLRTNNTSQDNSSHHSNITDNYYEFIFHELFFASFDTSNYTEEDGVIYKVVTCICICIGLPLTLVAIYALYSQVRNNHVAPIFVINLLISDLIQFCYMIIEVAQPEDFTIYMIFFLTYIYSLGVSVGFMVCVAMERYLVVACPLWYHFRRTIKICVVICVVVWALPALFFLTVLFSSPSLINITIPVFLLLPIPLLIFFLGGTLKALSASKSVPPDEKRRIVGMLVLVLFIYMLLFLPSIIRFLPYDVTYEILHLFPVFLQLSPLADLVLYVFMKKGTIDKLLASVCCCRMDSNNISSSTV